ncbi:T9SS type A sorting domain-containing protein [Apibacter adventoris]|uniref:Secretion system C-terminal sorting domain-containing protein n=1 Tax=Apibacter adventoris TaxID=1679466 RepID=A0A2S8A4M4_9FLAO|nr:T9SS type A sorting domain-containing protein [Apibacter adventoris]PQL89502.1 hypothetical protein C4S77_12745 [Apibacter adventoris]
MKKILIFMLLGCFISTQVLASGSPSAKQTYLKKNFTAPTTSNYDPMDVFGLLTFLMQYSEVTGKYNYEVQGITWEEMAAAISGNPDVIFVKLIGKLPEISPNLAWEKVGNSRVLTHLEFNKDSLTGIFDGKYFKNLKIFVLWHTQITSIDISKNINLVTLMCNLNKLTKLDVSHNSNLQNLSISGNKLNYIDVSKNKNLVILNCADNQLTNLDISKNTNLKELRVQYNHQLISLDVSKNTKLEILDITWTPLTSLDVSKNPNLKSLSCNNISELKSLDISKNPNLEWLSCRYTSINSLDVSNNPKLKILYCNSNYRLTTLDLSKNPNLEQLQCYVNKLKFSTLKGDFSKLDYKFSKLGPQASLYGGTKGFFELIDLSSEYNINGTLTTFKWYDAATNQEVTMFAANGTFYASPANAGKTLICKMTNASYPTLTLEYEVTITNSMTQGFSAKTRDFKIPENFTLTGPEAETSNLKIYPNPVIDVLKINTPSQIESVSIYDYSGNEVKKVSPVINKEVNLQGLSSGNYILTVKTSQGTITKKIIKK